MSGLYSAPSSLPKANGLRFTQPVLGCSNRQAWSSGFAGGVSLFGLPDDESLGVAGAGGLDDVDVSAGGADGVGSELVAGSCEGSLDLVDFLAEVLRAGAGVAAAIFLLTGLASAAGAVSVEAAAAGADAAGAAVVASPDVAVVLELSVAGVVVWLSVVVDRVACLLESAME